MTAKSYLTHCLLYAMALICLVVTVNYVVDPYAIFGMPRISHLNTYKVDIAPHVKMVKKYQPLLEEHSALVTGNTRVEIGFNPEHRCLVNSGLNLYNLGISGANVPTQLLYALNLIYQQPIKAVFVSLDFVDFAWTPRDNRFSDPPLSAFSIEGLKYSGSGMPDPAYGKIKLLDYFRSLFSLEALVSSLKTIALQDSAAPDRDDAGFNPAREYGEIVRVEGAGALFDKKRAELFEHFGTRWFVSTEDGRLDPSFNDLRIFLDIATARGIVVHLFLNPLHESYWELIRTQGHSHLYEEWRNELKAIAADYPADEVSLWDFAVDSPYIHEPIPPPGQKTGPLKWFWELSFYRRQLGDLMIDAMLSDSCGSQVAFGQRLH